MNLRWIGGGLLVLLLMNVTAGCGSWQGTGGRTRVERERAATSIYFEQERFDRVLKMAEEEQKAVFLDFYADWCAPCKWLDAGPFRDVRAAEYYNKHLIALKVDAEKGQGVALAQRYGIQAYPTLIWIKPTGEVIGQYVGVIGASALLERGQTAKAAVDAMYAPTTEAGGER